MKRVFTPLAPILLLVACGQPFRSVDPATRPDAGSHHDASFDAPTDVRPKPDGESIPAPPAQPRLEFRQVKTIHLAWSSVPGAVSYRVLEATDDTSPMVEVESEAAIDEPGFDHVVPLWKRAQARYAVKACNAVGCSESSPEVKVSFAGVLNNAVGYLKASNSGGGDRFGSAVALSEDGNTLVVGAADEDSSGEPSSNSVSGSGAAYVLVRRGSTWQQVQYLKSETPFNNARFGATLGASADGLTLVVGAPYDEQTGSVYVFEKTQDTWTQKAKLRASNPHINDEFGASVALSADGNALIVGAPGEASEGAAYHFMRSNGIWKPKSYIKSSDSPSWKGRFGSSVAISPTGSRVAVGVPDHQVDSLPTGGAVYVLKCNPIGCSHDFQLRVPVSPGHNVRFGASLAFAADDKTLAVGAPEYFEEPSAYGGAVLLFSCGGGGCVHDRLIRASNRTANAKFGSSVAFSNDGNVLLVGAVGEPSAVQGILLAGPSGPHTAAGSGAVYVLVRQDGVWRESAFLKAPNAYGGSSIGDSFGSGVAISGDGKTLVSSAPDEASASVGVGGPQSDNAAPGAGAVYLY